MPVADENLSEKLPFDVYAMMLILSFLLLGVAVWLINDELQQHWFAQQQGRNCAVHLTKINDKPDVLKDDVKVTQEDFDDWKAIENNDTKPPKFIEYTPWMLVRTIDTKEGVDNTVGIPEGELEQLKKSYEYPLNTPDDGGEAKKAEAPSAAPPANP